MRFVCLLLICLLASLVAHASAPASVKVTPAATSGVVSLTWSAVAGATGYNIRRAASPLAAPALLSANQLGTTFTDATAPAGVASWYLVSSLTAGGESAPISLHAAPGLILDNGATGTASTGTWTSLAAPASFGSNARSAVSVAADEPTATYTFRQTLPARGAYDVYLRWSDAPNRSATVPVWVYFDSDSLDNSNPAGAWSASSRGAAILKVTLDQTQAAGTWVRIGTVLCNGLLHCATVIRNNTGIDGQTVVADAVQLVPVGSDTAAYTVPVLADEFSGASLDTSKWTIWDGRSSVTQAGGELILTLRHKGTLRTDGSGFLDETEFDESGNRNWTAGGVHAPGFSQAYGYYEIRFRTTQETGVDNAFWMLTKGPGGWDSMELDVPEVWTRPGAHATYHGAGLGSWRTVQPPLGPGPEVRYWTSGKGHKYDGTDWTEYHTYGIEWRTDNTVIYYLDGIERWRSPILPDEAPGLDLISTFSPLYPIISTLPMDWMTIQPATAPGQFPPLHGMTMNVDYLRIMQKPGWTGAADDAFSNPANWGPDGVPSANTAAVFNTATARTAVSLPSGLHVRSLWMDTSAAPAFTFQGGPIKLGRSAPGVGGVMMTSQVMTSQTVNAPIEAQTNLQFANLSNNPSATLTLNGALSAAPSFAGETTTPSIAFNTLRSIFVNAPILAPVSNVYKWGISGSLHLSAGSTFTGDLLIENGPVRFSHPSALGGNPEAAVAFAPAYKHSESFRPRLTFTGPAETVTKLLRITGSSADGILEASGSGPLVWNGDVLIAPIQTPAAAGTTAATLTLGGTHTGNNTLTGRLSDEGASVTNDGVPQSVSLTLTKADAGTWVLAGTTVASGGVLINGGTLTIGAGSTGSLTAPSVSVASNATLALGRTDNWDFATPVTGTGSLRKRGSGRLTLSGTHTLTGQVSVEAGTLSLAGTIGGGSLLTVQAGASLTGTGSLSRSVSVNGELQLSPLQIGGSLSLSSGAALRTSFTTNAAPSAAVAATTLSIASGARVDVILNGPGSSARFLHGYWRSPRTFPLVTCLSRSGTLTLGTVSPDAMGNLAAAFGAFSLQHTSTGVNLVWTPIPGLPVLDDPTVALLNPAGPVVAVPSTSHELRLKANFTGGETTTLGWTLVSGPSAVSFGNATSSDTTATFAAAGTYRLRATATNGLGSAQAELTVLVAPPATVALRQGVSGYSHAATFIRGDSPSWNSGARDQFLIGRNGNQPMRGLLSFNLSTLPAGGTATSTVLELWIHSAGSGTTLGALSLHPLLVSFEEGTGNGTSAANGAGTGADWTNRFVATPWSTPGGQADTDFAANALSSVTDLVPTLPTGTAFTFQNNPAFVATVQGARTAGLPLNLLIKTDNDTTGANALLRIASDDHPTSTLRPRLTLGLDYPYAPTVEPGSIASVTTGAVTPLSSTVLHANTSLWTVLSGPGAVSFANPNEPTTTATFGASGSYLLRLSAANSHGETSRVIPVTASTLHEQWTLAHFGPSPDASISDHQADPDADGIPNLVEFALGLTPTVPNPRPITFSPSSAALSVEYSRPVSRLGAADLVAEWTDALTLAPVWSTVGVSTEVLADDGMEQRLRASVPHAGPGPRFLRLRASLR